MSSAVIGNLRATLGLDSAQFEAGARRAQATLADLRGTLTKFAAGVAGALSIDALVGGAIDALHEVANMGDLAETIGITAEQVQVFNRMALASGASTDAMARGLQSITEQSTQAGSALGKLFDANGFKVKTMDAQQAIMTFMNLLQQARTPAEQLQMATSVLGDKVGRELVEAMRTGAAGFDAAMQDMVQSGIYHTNAEVARLQEIETRYNQVAAHIKTIWQSMIVEIATGLEGLWTTFGDSVNQMGASEAKAALATAQAELARLKADATEVTGRAKYEIDKQIQELESRIRILQMATDGALRSAPGKSDRQFPVSGPHSVLPPEPIKAARKEVDETVKALERLKEAGQAVWEETRTPMEQYQLALRKLNDLREANVIGDEEYGRKLEMLKEQFFGAAQAAETFGSKVAEELEGRGQQWIDQWVDGTFEIKDALNDLARDLAKGALHNVLSSLLNMGGPGGSGAGILGTLLGGLFGGFGGLFADGGHIPAGKWGVVGEAGYPEIVHGPGTVTPMKDLALGGAAGVVQVEVSTSEDLWAKVDAKVQQGNRQAVQVAVTESVRQADRNFAASYRDKQIRKF